MDGPPRHRLHGRGLMGGAKVLWQIRQYASPNWHVLVSS